jgi:hypothetical protein
MWLRMGLLKTDVTEERVASILRAEEITRAMKSVDMNVFLLRYTPVASTWGTHTTGDKRRHLSG